MINRQQQEIDKIFLKLDKIAKKGPEYMIEYYKFVDEMLIQGKYSEFKECLNLYYNYSADSLDVSTVKKESWSLVRFYTNSNFQEQRQKLFDSKGVYQVALDLYKDIPLTKAKVVDSIGTGCELQPITENGGVTSINILKQGLNYSASASVLITGGTSQATATAEIKSGRVIKINLGATGSGHNKLLKLGRIQEFDQYQEDVTNKLTKDQYQRIIKNKTTFLVVTKDGQLQGETFSNWSLSQSYDKNLLKLYTQGVNYLLS